MLLSPETAAVFINILLDPALRKEIIKGNITLALIRPELETTTNLRETTPDITDVEIAEDIESQIVGLGVITKFTMQFDQTAYEGFYSEAKELLRSRPPRHDESYETQWEEFGSVMVGGPVTVLLLQSDDGNAVKKLRDQIGHRDIENRRDPATIRGQIGVDNYSTIIHSSDCPESVINETDIIIDCICRQLSSVC